MMTKTDAESSKTREFSSSRNPLRRLLATAVLVGFFLGTGACGGGGSTGTGGGITAGVYSSGSSTSGVVPAGVITGTTTVNFSDATLYLQSDGTMTFVDMTDNVTCTGTGTISGSTLSGKLTCSIPNQPSFQATFSGTMNGTTISGTYVVNNTTYSFSLPSTNVTSQPSIILNQTFTIAAGNSYCPASTTTSPNIQNANGMGFMCPTSATITVSGGAITSGSMTLDMPAPPNPMPVPMPNYPNCTMAMGNANQTITFTKGTLTAIPGLANVYTATNLAGTVAFNMSMTWASCPSGLPTSFSTSNTTLFPSGPPTFTMSSGTASLVSVSGHDILVLGGAVTFTENGTSDTNPIPNTAL